MERVAIPLSRDDHWLVDVRVHIGHKLTLSRDTINHIGKLVKWQFWAIAFIRIGEGGNTYSISVV